MADEKTLSQMIEELKVFNTERDWDQYHSPRNMAMALSVEASELLELYLWSRDDGPQPAVSSRNDQVQAEIGDVLICLLNLCYRAGVDPVAAFDAKLAANAERYPAARVKGSMRKYDEYDE